ncbi:MAG: hypothetical protein AAFY71_22540 [Bacteroidota bacterium]
MNEYKHELRLMGYWHASYETEYDYPDPGQFVDEEWDEEEKELVLAYLKKGEVFVNFRGSSWCRFKCGVGPLGFQELTDGFYVWPSGLSHYVEEHQVRLPQEFVDHVKEGKPINKERISFIKRTSFSIDQQWWIRQKGHGTIQTYKSPVEKSETPWTVSCPSPQVEKEEEAKLYVSDEGVFDILIINNGYFLFRKDFAQRIHKEVPDLSFKPMMIFQPAKDIFINNYLLVENLAELPANYIGQIKRKDFKRKRIWAKGNNILVSPALKKWLEEEGYFNLRFQLVNG